MRIEELVTMPDAADEGPFALVLEEEAPELGCCTLVIRRMAFRISLAPTAARILAANLVAGADECERRQERAR